MAHAGSPSVSCVDAFWPARGALCIFAWPDPLEAALAFARALGGAAMVRRRPGV
jgi:hypothetical protein